MTWSLKLGRIAGIPIYIHWTFLILLVYIAFIHYVPTRDLAKTAEGVLFILTLFGCVLLHELGHALAARRYGVPTADITLFIIGGVARLQRIPEKPRQEFVIAVAGPLVNVAIAVVLVLLGVPLLGRVLLFMFGMMFGLTAVDPESAPRMVEIGFWTKVLWANLFIFFFNLLPAFPMDGGRILRSLLAMSLDYGVATQIAASIGQMMAIGFGLVGLMSFNPFLVLIALFVWIGAGGEAYQVQERLALKNISVREAMLTDFHTLSPDDTLGDAAELLLAGSQHDFPVLDNGRVSGILTRSDLMNGLAKGGRGARVGDFRRQELGVVQAHEMLVPVLARLREQGESCLLVKEGDEPVGLLTLENIGEFLMIRTALDQHPSNAQRPEPLIRA